MKAYKEVVTQQELFDVSLEQSEDIKSEVRIVKTTNNSFPVTVATISEKGIRVSPYSCRVVNLDQILFAQGSTLDVPDSFKTAIIDEHESGNNNVLKLTDEQANLLFRLLHCHVAHSDFIPIHNKLANIVDYNCEADVEGICLESAVDDYGTHFLRNNKP